jgi:diguanylate cyclase (GGDEF)-like protein
MCEDSGLLHQNRLVHIENASAFDLLTRNTSDWIIVLDENNYEWLFSNKSPEIALTDIAFKEIINKWMMSQIKAKSNKGNIETDFSHKGIAQSFVVNMFGIVWLEIDAMLFIFTDISQDREKLLEDVAYRDPLTRVYSRYYGILTLQKYIQSNIRFILCFIDIDQLKYVNDKYGHVFGDRYILKVAATLKEFSSEAIISRIGGDEFLLLDEFVSIDDAKTVLETLSSKLLSNKDEKTPDVNFNFSYGIIERNVDDLLDIEQLLSLVDKEMYRHKCTRKDWSGGTLPV